MPWFKVDDNADLNEKVVLAGNEAWGLFCRLGPFASRQLTDGRIPVAIAEFYSNGNPDLVPRLIEVGLLHEFGHRCDECAAVPLGFLLIHGFLERNPSASEVRADRAKAARRQADWRAKKKVEQEAKDLVKESLVVEHGLDPATVTNTVSNAVTNTVTDGVTNTVRNGCPDPTRPDPTIEEQPIAPPARRNRPPDLLWDAVMDVCGITSSDITDSSRGAYNRALAELRGVSATPDEVRRRAANYRLHFTDAVLTPTALAKQWAKCAQGPSGVAPLRRSRAADMHSDYLERHREAQ